MEWVRQALDTPGLTLVPLTPEIAVDSTRLPGNLHGDPADRILVATARNLGARVGQASRPVRGGLRGRRRQSAWPHNYADLISVHMRSRKRCVAAGMVAIHCPRVSVSAVGNSVVLRRNASGNKACAAPFAVAVREVSTMAAATGARSRKLMNACASSGRLALAQDHCVIAIQREAFGRIGECKLRRGVDGLLRGGGPRVRHQHVARHHLVAILRRSDTRAAAASARWLRARRDASCASSVELIRKPQLQETCAQHVFRIVQHGHAAFAGARPTGRPRRAARAPA